MKNSTLFHLVCAVLIFFSACSEKELIMPDTAGITKEDLQTLKQRPPTRPDSVEVYAGFYNTAEVVFPKKRPERAVKAMVAYGERGKQKEEIEVVDFDEILVIEELELEEYEFLITYIGENDAESTPLVRSVTPYGPVYDYITPSLEGEGRFGIGYIYWENITGQEVEVTATYTDGGEEVVSRLLSSELRDTLIVKGLPKEELELSLQINDLEKERSSEIKVIKIESGLSLEEYALASLEAEPTFGAVNFTWENPIKENLLLELTYEIGGETFSISQESNDEDGTFEIPNLPQGNLDITATFTHVLHEMVSQSRTFSLAVQKGAREAVMESVRIGSSGGNMGVLKANNVSNTAVSLEITYTKTNNAEETLEVDLPEQTQNFIYTLLLDASDNTDVKVKVIDQYGDVEETFSSTVKAIINKDWYPESVKTTWMASASSVRGGWALPERTLRENTEHWENEWGSSASDSTGTPSNQTPHWLKVNTTEVRVITGFKYRTGSDSYHPKKLELQYSIDGENWITATQFEDTATPSGNRVLDVPINEPFIAKYVRMYITESTNSTCRVSQIHLEGEDFDWTP